MEQIRRRRFARVSIPVIIGLTGLFSVINRPRFETYRTVDVLELLASGVCFGVALVWLVTAFRGPAEG